MAWGRRKKETDKTLESLIRLFFAIPLNILALFKWRSYRSAEKARTEAAQSAYRSSAKESRASVPKKETRSYEQKHTSTVRIKMTPQQNLTEALKRAAEKKQQEEARTNQLKQEDATMATKLGAGKYIFGENLPEGTYDLKAVAGEGLLLIQKSEGESPEEEIISFGTDRYCAKTYHGLSRPKGWYFKVTDNVVFEITRATMIEIE